ncbi:pleckstrin homology domain-containing family G member 1 isoform X3 [Aethina tumida]|nr:pleckstrin homology domain-containing family G member 1 isoform X3 [Aethina tumida]XP_049819707.1 pleckstrin homology domain-containing family G member 1 isoform X3 [Aethina tumida]
MPSIMGAFDAIIGSKSDKECGDDLKRGSPKRTYQASNFAFLSPGVQKILSHVPDQEISKQFSSEETLGPRRFGPHKANFRSLRSPEKMQKSSENLEGISPNVQKILSNLQDTELVLNTIPKKTVKNSSYLHKEHLTRSYSADVNENTSRQYLYTSDSKDFSSVSAGLSDRLSEGGESGEVSDNYSPKPLGSYLHSPQGIASRTPVGRKNLGKYLQVPSESSVGTMSSTNSSEVSRPVSLTSLGSCSSSGSSGPQQPGSTYLASAESLDSDNEHGGSADSGIAEQPITPEMRVLQEVLDTESVYVSDLDEVIQGYLEPWKNDPDCPLIPHLQHLFSNIVEIHEFNRKLLIELRQVECNPTEIAKVFLQNHSGFSVYNEYCTNYPNTMDVLGQLQRDEKMVPLFKERQLELEHALPLGSYLLKPVQRILKYHLLLQRLSKQCEPQHTASVNLALTTMTSIATNINNMKRKHENAVRVQEILAQLYGWSGPDLTTLGELIAEGTFKLIGARAKRHVFLFEKVLLMAKRKENGVLVYKSHIMCSNLMLVEQVRGEALCFHVIPFDNPKLQSTLVARSLSNKREWCMQIKRVILENFDAKIPSHARELVMELGQDVHENGTDSPNDKWSTYKPYSTPDYLERRSRVRKSRNLSNRRASSQDRSFTSLSNWRRKSEPEMIPQYNSKTMPKRISQMKKAKEVVTAKFYTDLYDSETCDNPNESMESLPENMTESELDVSQKSEERSEETTNLEKIVSELLQQSRPEFNKLLNNQPPSRPRRTLSSDPSSTIWYDDRSKLPSKADSLPRSFQLNDQIDSGSKVAECRNEQLILDQSLKESPNDGGEEQQENDLSSQLDDNEHPEHKIYRKSQIRLSVVQRIKNLMFEEQKTSQKSPRTYKQGSKSMGEKIANPDYEDPQKLFLHSRNSSQVNLTSESQNEVDCDLGERVELDLSINENDVLKEIEKRLQTSTNISDTGQITINNQSSQSEESFTKSKFNSSQNSDSYYESILDKSLTEEYVKDSNGKMVIKSDSFSSNENKLIYHMKYNSLKNVTVIKKDSFLENKSSFKRPTKAPPPIPAKPTIKVSNGTNDLNSNCSNNSSEENKSDKLNSTETINNSSNISCNRTFLHNQNGSTSVTTTSWVKTVVNRFE